MDRELTEQKIEKVLIQVREMPEDTKSDKAVRTCILELLEFCKEATWRIDTVITSGRAVRANLLLSSIRDVKRDGAIVVSLLRMNPDYHEMQADLLDSINSFTEFVEGSLDKIPLLVRGPSGIH